jgi:Leucine-rich repeat (LRR) protein
MKKSLLSLTFFLLSIALIAQVSQKEEKALLDIFATMNGENWVHTWDIDQPVSGWHGVTVKNNKVIKINLLFNNLEGNLPTSIGDLKNLKTLELSFNKITGPIPSEIGLLSKLEVLGLNGNNIEGGIPSTIGSLSALKELHLSSNKIDGRIPSSLSNLTNLEVFNVFDNSIFGTLPIELSYSKNLKQIVIAKNNIIENDAFASLLLFENITDQKNNLAPSVKTIIATETSDDN